MKKQAETVSQFILAKSKKRAEIAGIKPDISDITGGQTSLTASGLFDSLSFLNLLAEIEKEFKVDIDLFMHDPEYFTTLKGLTSIVVDASDKKPAVSSSDNRKKDSSQIRYEEITPAHPEWQTLGTLFGEMYAYFEKHGLKMPLREDGEQSWLKSLESTIGKTNHVIGSVDNGKLVGFIHASLKIFPGFLKEKLGGTIANVYVQPEYRRQGIAEELVNRADAWFNLRKVGSVDLQVITENKAGIGFWKKMGFKSEVLQMRKKSA